MEFIKSTISLAKYPTLYEKFTLFYIGFFGITLVINPSIHAADGPYPSPMAYWTTISDQTTFAFRFLGISFLSVVLAPKFFGMSSFAFVKMTAAMAVGSFFLFAWYGLWAPLDTAVTKMWKIQAYVQGAYAGWALIVANGITRESYSAFVAAYYSFFGVSLMIAPEVRVAAATAAQPQKRDSHALPPLPAAGLLRPVEPLRHDVLDRIR